ncbi:MAG: AAA family ATPase [Rhodospirillaceae bacterium]|nr:AAA family ATPase [Rhodospirillaceae bacterium]
MSVPVLTFFNNKGGVGKTSLVYHLAWMFSNEGKRILACDLDPQANLTASFVEEDSLEAIWSQDTQKENNTIYQCVSPLAEVGDLKNPHVREISQSLAVVCGDLSLSGFEEILSGEWTKALDTVNLYRPFRILTAFWQVMQSGAKMIDADMIMVDVGPNLGAINRSALIATDYVVIPVAADMFSLQGLRNLAPTLARWRKEWSKRREGWGEPGFPLPDGGMKPIGYIVQQHGERQGRPVKAYGKWAERIPREYARTAGQNQLDSIPISPEEDINCLGTVRHFRSLVPMAQEARKPIFHLKPADGAIGSHAAAVQKAYQDFRDLANRIVRLIEGSEK